MLHGVERKTRGTVQMFEVAGEQSGKEVNGVFLYLTQGRFRRGKLEVINIRSRLSILLVEAAREAAVEGNSSQQGRDCSPCQVGHSQAMIGST
jgi:hypothetical protein